MRQKVVLLGCLVLFLFTLHGYALDVAEEIECQELLEALEKNEDKKDADRMTSLLFTAASVFTRTIVIPVGGSRGDLTEEGEKLLKLKLKNCGIEVEP